MTRLCAMLLACLFFSHAALAGLPPAALASAEAVLPRDAALPLTLRARDLSGAESSIGAALGGGPGFVLFADYTCKTLCGPALVLLTAALADSGLAPTAYRIVVIGLDPKDSASDARALRDAEVPPPLRANTSFLLPDATALAALTNSVGFHFVYDAAADQFAHPELVYAVAANGHVLRLLSPFALTTSDMKTALAAPAPPASLYARVRLLCYRFAALNGPYGGPIAAALKASGVLTVLALGGAILLLTRRRKAPYLRQDGP